MSNIMSKEEMKRKNIKTIKYNSDGTKTIKYKGRKKSVTKIFDQLPKMYNQQPLAHEVKKPSYTRKEVTEKTFYNRESNPSKVHNKISYSTPKSYIESHSYKVKGKGYDEYRYKYTNNKTTGEVTRERKVMHQGEQVHYQKAIKKRGEKGYKVLNAKNTI